MDADKIKPRLFVLSGFICVHLRPKFFPLLPSQDLADLRHGALQLLVAAVEVGRYADAGAGTEID
jgi:hypothetical protein